MAPERRNDERRVRFQMFTAMFAGWSKVFQEAADFASELGPDRVISISHSEGKNESVVTVWFWE